MSLAYTRALAIAILFHKREFEYEGIKSASKTFEGLIRLEAEVKSSLVDEWIKGEKSIEVAVKGVFGKGSREVCSKELFNYNVQKDSTSNNARSNTQSRSKSPINIRPKGLFDDEIGVNKHPQKEVPLARTKSENNIRRSNLDLVKSRSNVKSC